MLLARDPGLLLAAHSATGEYLRDLHPTSLPHYANFGPELTRDFRGLRLWLPLWVHGVGAFREALDEQLDLARFAYHAFRRDRRFATPLHPDLSIVVVPCADSRRRRQPPPTGGRQRVGADLPLRNRGQRALPAAAVRAVAPQPCRARPGRCRRPAGSRASGQSSALGGKALDHGFGDQAFTVRSVVKIHDDPQHGDDEYDYQRNPLHPHFGPPAGSAK